ncbi:16315_t:CDS:2 [Entrophospora sp. SA101]|nr:10640_t:CDS:2 [Entrophospora sp. SA101]CAJ0628441.1 15037_t:CDS:2 [Entrophospora sp. SA101]CAJ0628446.1 15040_t:CDS:2 [Entrophospora sp. SA101]CAJ0752013.1 16315_t:CDS:2 [Entrophospora sp. SA101]CAJ0849805.1 514_t:CDS:2 [Entrophospora sp. SA101]
MGNSFSNAKKLIKKFRPLNRNLYVNNDNNSLNFLSSSTSTSFDNNKRTGSGRKKSNNNRGNPPNYVWPIDEKELNRLKTQHYCFKEMFDKNYSAPIQKLLEKGGKGLDIGCGPGLFVLEMASEFKNSEFIGVDFLENFPKQTLPYNVGFVRANVLDGLSFPDNKFDYVHICCMNYSFTENQWIDIVIPELVRVTKPGGWIEYYDMGPSVTKAGPIFMRLHEALDNLLIERGLNTQFVHKIKSTLQRYPNLQNMEGVLKKQPIGNWGGKLGELNLQNTLEFFDVIKDLMINALGINEPEYMRLVKELAKEFDENKSRIHFVRVFAQKFERIN